MKRLFILFVVCLFVVGCANVNNLPTISVYTSSVVDEDSKGESTPASPSLTDSEESTDPAVPEQSVEPTEPTEPVEPTESVDPAVPEQSVEPTEPTVPEHNIELIGKYTVTLPKGYNSEACLDFSDSTTRDTWTYASGGVRKLSSVTLLKEGGSYDTEVVTVGRDENKIIFQKDGDTVASFDCETYGNPTYNGYKFSGKYKEVVLEGQITSGGSIIIDSVRVFYNLKYKSFQKILPPDISDRKHIIISQSYTNQTGCIEGSYLVGSTATYNTDKNKIIIVKSN